ncbi:MAG: ABC transporter permease subunit [Planctomycetota bacterium]
MSDRWDRIRELRRQRPRNRFLRFALAGFGLLTAAAWLGGDIGVGDLFGARRLRNLERFFTVDLASDEGFLSVAGRVAASPGLSATGATLAISVLGIVLAGFAGACFALPAARNFMARDPFVDPSRRPRGVVSGFFLGAVRLFLLFLRSVPEFIWAYLFLAMFGPSAWPAVLALALHNAGTLGKLDSEVIEDLEPAAPAALRAIGLPRLRIAQFGLFPLVLPRFLLYFFYRFETCVREATVLGMIGVVSLGYHIGLARAIRAYDEMIVLVLMGAGLVLAADLLSALTRRIVRRAV